MVGVLRLTWLADPLATVVLKYGKGKGQFKELFLYISVLVCSPNSFGVSCKE